MTLVDTHAHLQDTALRDDLPGLILRAKEAGVTRIVAIGITAHDSATVVEIAEAHAGIFAAVGIQPNHTAEAVEADWGRILELARHPRVVAIGETGLDRYWDHSPFEVQRGWFDRHLKLAHELDLPVVIHCRDCEQEIIDRLARLQRPVRGILHSFTGTWEHALQFLELGLHLSFAGMVTFTNKKLDPLRDVAARIPIDRILVETDSPYLSPHPFRGRPNEPARVAFTAARIAEARGIPPVDFAMATTANARRLFRLGDADAFPEIASWPEIPRDRTLR